MRSVFCYFLVVIALQSCAPKIVSPTSVSPIMEEKSDDSLKHFPPTQLKLQSTYWQKIKLITDTVDPFATLDLFYPAPFSEEDEWYVGNQKLSYWNCPTCLKRTFVDWNNSADSIREYLTFPFEENYTFVQGQLNYQHPISHKSYSLVSFSTNSYPEMTGRFNPGVLSMALFEKDKQWKVKNFNWGVHAQGQFSAASTPDTVCFSPSGKAFFGLTGGTANGVSPEDYYPIFSDFYLFDADSLQEIVHLSSTECWSQGDGNLGSFWETKLDSITEEDQSIHFFFAIEGSIDKELFWGKPWLFEWIPTQEWEALESNFSFTGTQEIILEKHLLTLQTPKIMVVFEDKKTGYATGRTLKCVKP